MITPSPSFHGGAQCQRPHLRSRSQTKQGRHSLRSIEAAEDREDARTPMLDGGWTLCDHRSSGRPLSVHHSESWAAWPGVICIPALRCGSILLLRPQSLQWLSANPLTIPCLSLPLMLVCQAEKAPLPTP